MDEKELRHRIERSQQEMDYWRSRADQMRSVLDNLETDYLTHRTDCFVVRKRRFREAVGRALDAVTVLEGGGSGDPDDGTASSTSSGRSSPTENASLLGAVEYSRNMRRVAIRSQLKCMLTW